MELQNTAIQDVKQLTPKLFKDHRGYFFESYNQATFEKLGIYAKFVQDNQSVSKQYTLRGLHFQESPHAQDKLVYVVEGKIFDVAVDIRPESPTFGKWVGEYLDSDSKKMLFIPKGFAHGFLVLSPQAIVTYKCSHIYTPTAENSIIWNDPTLNIQWPLPPNAQPLLSPKDIQAPLYNPDYFKKI